MSTSPYSQDLRTKVIRFLESGNIQKVASLVFDLNPSTVSRWWLRYKKEGHYRPRIRKGKLPRISAKALEIYIDAHPDFKAYDLGKHFGMSTVGAFYWLKKLGYSYKKKPFSMWKRTLIKEKNI